MGSSYGGGHHAINACLAPLYSVEGMHIITVEGVGNRKTGLHPVQESLANSHGSQCGFCTPGFVMSMYALLRSSKILQRRSKSRKVWQGIYVDAQAIGQLWMPLGYLQRLMTWYILAELWQTVHKMSSYVHRQVSPARVVQNLIGLQKI